MYSMIGIRGDPELMKRWQSQVARQRRRRIASGPRPLAAIGYLLSGATRGGLIDVRRLMAVVVHDRELHGRLAIRVAGYGVVAVPWGIRIGGAQQHRFVKDLLLAPAVGARGQRLDLNRGEVLNLALALERYLERACQQPHAPRRWKPHLPQLWATFEPDVAHELSLAGPEFEAYHRLGLSERSRQFQRTVAGLPAFPLEFVSHQWLRFVGVFADLATVGTRQVITLGRRGRNLRGFSGAVEYDLLCSRFDAP